MYLAKDVRGASRNWRCARAAACGGARRRRSTSMGVRPVVLVLTVLVLALPLLAFVLALALTTVLVTGPVARAATDYTKVVNESKGTVRIAARAPPLPPIPGLARLPLA